MTSSLDKPLFALGIDIASKSFQVALKSTTSKRYYETSFSNTPQGFTKLLAWLAKHNQDRPSLHACMEATGPYGEDLALFLDEQGFKVSVVNPRQIAH